MPNGKPKRGESISVEDDDEEEEEEEEPGSPSEQCSSSVNGKKGGQRKPETEEEKRKNFLERNRQGMSTEFALSLSFIASQTHLTLAALKCRQRKKAWLAQLQAKNEYLTQENQRLQEALVSTREELARLSAVGPMIPVGVAANAPPNAHPVSVNVSLPATASAKSVVGARGYGY
jgi:ATF/CREB family transcription factor